jgi:hypothetical protein
MNLRDLREIINEAAEEWQADKASRLGAALAYYSTFSIGPLLILTIAVARNLRDPRPQTVAADSCGEPTVKLGRLDMTRKGILAGAAALAALGVALVDVNNAEAGRRRCCCNAYGWSGAYGTTQTTSYGPTNQAPPSPQTFDGTPAPAPGYGEGTPHGTQYGPRGTIYQGPNGATGAVREGATGNPNANRDGTARLRRGTNAQGGTPAPSQNGTGIRPRSDEAARPAPGSPESPDSTQK